MLPETDNFKPSGSGEGPLANCEDWVNTVGPARAGEPARRETNTMPQWAGSCWYYLRFIDPKNEDALIDGSLEKYWLPVDLYVGGAEHAVLHLLYARFWHKVLYDIGVVSTKEPFQRLVSQGMILGEVEYSAHVDADGASSKVAKTSGLRTIKVPASDVTKKGDGFVLTANPKVKVSARAHKMSKSRGNVVNPDDVVDEYGADSLRLYEMFMGPLRDTKVWQTKGVEGCSRFLARTHRLFDDNVTDEKPDGRGPRGVEQVRRQGDGGNRADAFQHRHLRDDGTHQRLHENGQSLARHSGAVFFAVVPLRAAPQRRDVGASRPLGIEFANGLARRRRELAGSRHGGYRRASER